MRETTQITYSKNRISLRADLIPGADTLLHELKRRGYPLALVGDGPAATFRNNLSPYGLYDLFDAYAISEEVGVHKPHPKIFLHALDQLKIPPQDYDKVVMVGNYLARDIKGANNLDLISVWLDWSPRRPKTPADKSEAPQFTIKTPLELLQVINTIEIRAQGKVLIPELVRLAFDQDLPVDGAPARAIALLCALRDAQAAELGELSAWLDRAGGDWRNELLTRRCGKVSGYTTPELEAIAADAQYSIHVRSSATEGLVERARRQPAQRERIIAFMRALLTRPEADAASEEMFVGLLIGDALDLDSRELYPDIQRAFAEDRVDTSIITLLDVHERWGLSPLTPPRRRKDGMYLRLRCTACNRVREHFVQDVLLDVQTLEQQTQGQAVAYNPYIMDHEIVCPKCGAVDRYAMTPQAFLALTVLPKKIDDLAALLSGKKSATDLPPNPRLHPFRSNVFGRPMHPLAGLEEYRRRIAANPKDAKLYMRMGTLLRTLYRRPEALEAHRQAYALNPNDAEIALTRGMSEHDFGDRSAAKEIYERVLALELNRERGLGNCPV